MKTRLKHGLSQPTTIKKKHPVFNRLRSIMTFNKQMPDTYTCSVRIDVLEQRLLEERLIELEAERKRTSGLAYVNMLPPR